jgi:epoxyqueuosine reductase
MSLTQAIKAEANRLGFQLAGVTTPEQPPHFAFFQDWLAAGRQGEMAYLAAERSRQRRADPRLILPECRSILVLGIRYPAPEAGEAGPDPSTSLRMNSTEHQHPERSRRVPVETQNGEPILGRVASYAWGADYHEVLTERLRALVAFIEEQVGQPFPNRWYTDTGPVLERDLAQRAGLGWIGKNTCMIHPSLGSYFLLAEVLLGIDLEPDSPFVSDHCGSCTRCIEACPTDCILPDRSLNAARCISYLTIELKGSIPQELRPQIGDWVFGCDICQQVCPWNLRFAGPGGDPAFAPRPPAPRPALIQELSLTSEEFNRKFSPSKRSRSPVKRAKRRGYLRNVAVALGNSRSPAAAPALALALEGDEEPLVRGHAAWALGRIGGQAAHHALKKAAGCEPDPYVLSEIHSALAALEPQSESATDSPGKRLDSTKNR